MTFDQINAFIAVTQYNNFSKAADSIFVTQPTLSRRITDLEDELGVKLVERKKGVRSVQLTSAGISFIPVAEEWRRLWTATKRLTSTEANEKLRITSTHTVSNYLMLDIIKKFNSRALPIYLHIMDSASVDAFRRIEHDEADFAIVGNVMSSRFAVSQLIAREDIVFASSINSAYGPEVNAEELNSSDEIYVNWGPPQRTWHEYWFGSDIHPMMRLENVSLAEAFFSESNNPYQWMLMCHSAAKVFEKRGILKISKLNSPVPPRQIYLVSRLPKKQPYHDYLIEDIRSALSNEESFDLIDT